MIKAVIFDLGGVLIDWNPRYLYRKLFDQEEGISDFLARVCTSDWNEEQDAGRSLEEGTAALLTLHPGHEARIRAYYGRWEEMLGGEIPGTLALLKELKDKGSCRLFALTNWSRETFPIALDRFVFLQWFEGIVVSGTEGIRKPERAFYQLLLDRYSVNVEEALFIDDNLRNVLAAREMGMQAVHFRDPEALRGALEENGLL